MRFRLTSLASSSSESSAGEGRLDDLPIVLAIAAAGLDGLDTLEGCNGVRS
jgi:hypothetical protein